LSAFLRVRRNGRSLLMRRRDVLLLSLYVVLFFRFLFFPAADV